jgi:hypothetical protein
MKMHQHELDFETEEQAQAFVDSAMVRRFVTVHPTSGSKVIMTSNHQLSERVVDYIRHESTRFPTVTGWKFNKTA